MIREMYEGNSRRVLISYTGGLLRDGQDVAEDMGS